MWMEKNYEKIDTIFQKLVIKESRIDVIMIEKLI